MKRDRNSFFSSYGVTSSVNNMPPQGINNYPNMANMYLDNMGYNNGNNNIEDRINKLEREISRLDARISKLENVGQSTVNNDYNFANSMYMV